MMRKTTWCVGVGGIGRGRWIRDKVGERSVSQTWMILHAQIICCNFVIEYSFFVILKREN